MAETEAMCNCLCLFDVDMEIIYLTPGIYEVQVLGAYDVRLQFLIDLEAGPSGHYCEERSQYPWM